MPKLTDTVRITTAEDHVWRTCTRCELLAPLPADIEHCEHCQRIDTMPPQRRHTSQRGGVR